MILSTRRPGQEIVIDENTSIVVVSVVGNKVALGVTAPRDATVNSLDNFERRFEERELRVIARAG